jgi:hypothetical protein
VLVRGDVFRRDGVHDDPPFTDPGLDALRP